MWAAAPCCHAQDVVTPALSGLPRSLSAWGPLGAPLQALGVGLASDWPGLPPQQAVLCWRGHGQEAGRGVWEPALLSRLTMAFAAAVQSLDRVSLFAAPRAAAHQASLVLHHVLEPAQTHVHRVSDAVQPSHPLSSFSPPAFSLSQHWGLFQGVSPSHQVAKVLEF